MYHTPESKSCPGHQAGPPAISCCPDSWVFQHQIAGRWYCNGHVTLSLSRDVREVVQVLRANLRQNHLSLRQMTAPTNTPRLYLAISRVHYINIMLYLEYMFWKPKLFLSSSVSGEENPTQLELLGAGPDRSDPINRSNWAGYTCWWIWTQLQK